MAKAEIIIQVPREDTFGLLSLDSRRC